MNNIEKKYKKNHESIDSNTFNEIEKNYDVFENNLNNYNYGYDYYLTNIKML